MMRIKCLIFSAVFLLGAAPLLLTGCARYRDMPPGTVKEIRGSGFEGVGVTDLQKAKPESGLKTVSPVVEQETVTVLPLDNTLPSPDYIVGPYDVLSINVSGKPEFSSMGSSSGSSSSNTSGSSSSTASNLGVGTQAAGCRVDGSGNIQLPFVGTVHVWGMTLLEIQDRLMAIYPKYLNDPWVIVDIMAYRSHPLYLLGQFKNSGIFYMDRPLNLLQGIALGSGYDASADLSAARLIRDNKTAPVDIDALLTRGDQTQNVWLKEGDTLYIPDNRNRLVFVFGAVKKGGPIAIPSAGLTLTQAIASAELRDTGYDFRYVRIIRSHSATRGELMVVDFEKILRGDALPLALRNGDIVYVPKSQLGDWNDAINEILPSLQAISAILQPFVQIKYLNQPNY
jgi:polysaccharide export outer membrane protein